MNISYRTDKNVLYIALEGRIDASNAASAEEEIFRIKQDHPEKHTVIEASASSPSARPTKILSATL